MLAERDQNRMRIYSREGTHMYLCRHAERLDTAFPNWHSVIQSEPTNWPPGFHQACDHRNTAEHSTVQEPGK